MKFRISGLNRALRTLSLLSAAILVLPGLVRADAVTDWNAIAVQATVTAARPGPSGVLDIAMVLFSRPTR